MKPYERRYIYIYIYINIEVIINNKVYYLRSKVLIRGIIYIRVTKIYMLRR